MLTKSDYKRYVECPIHLWLRRHRRDALPSPDSDPQRAWRIEQGEMVEAYARMLFPDGVLVTDKRADAERCTRRLVGDGAGTIFQATAIADGLFAMADVLKFDQESQAWDIYEVKSGTKAKKYLDDIAFQRLAFAKAGYRIGRTFIIHVNPAYERRGGISPATLLSITDVTRDSEKLAVKVEAEVTKAIALLAQTSAPTRDEVGCNCSPKDCPCVEHCYPDVPEYSVFHLRGIHAKKARELYDGGVRLLTDLPATFRCNARQSIQLDVARSGVPIIRYTAIRRMLESLRYPLYFLDYETWSPAVPMFDGYRPYQQMVFQYSLHVQREFQGAIDHRECLVSERCDPRPIIVKRLAEDIGNDGTVIVWNSQFEANRNDELAQRFPEFAELLDAINRRIFDLMDVFRDGHYVHPNFRGSCSIKDVLPVLVPALSYRRLAIQEGGTASLTWYRMLTDGRSADAIAAACNDLLAYCKLDTQAMTEVLRHLEGIAM